MPCKDCKKRDRCGVPCPTLSKLLGKEFVHGREYLFCEIEKENEGGGMFNKCLDVKRDEGLLYPVEIEAGLDSRPMPKLTTTEAYILGRFNNGMTYKQVARALSGPGRRFNETKIRNILRKIRKKTKAVERVD